MYFHGYVCFLPAKVFICLFDHWPLNDYEIYLCICQTLAQSI